MSNIVDARDCLEGILWENDVMRKQLAEIGKKFGEKMDDVRSVVRGEWIVHRAGDGEEDVECSACGSTPSWRSTPSDAAPRYCPWCGTYMW